MTYLRLLFWLKWTLMWRGYRRNMSAAFGVILSLLLFLPLAAGLAVGCAFGFLNLAPPYNEDLLRGVLLAIYLFWVLVPLLGYALSDSYDITKLLGYPLSVRQIFTGVIVGSLIDFPVLVLLPVLLAALAGFTHSAAALPLVAVALALFLFHTLSLSQAIILASAGVLRSRRFRDVATVLIPLFWIGYYVLTHSLSQGWLHLDVVRFLHSRAWATLGYLPSGFAARAIAAAGQGEYAPALGFLLGLFVFAAATVAAAGWLIERVYAGEGVSGGQGSVTRRGRKGRAVVERGDKAVSEPLPALTPDHRPLTTDRLPPVVAAVAEKEFRYLCRDPYFKIALMNMVYILFVGAFMVGPQGTTGAPRSPYMLGIAMALVLFAEMQVLFNCFGTEGAAATVLFLFPSARRQILMGKNLTLFIAFTGVNLLFMLALGGIAGVLSDFGLLYGGMELATIVFIAVGNLASIWFPVRVVLRGWRIRQQSASRGCGYTFVYLGLGAVAFALLVPVLAALLVPMLWVSGAWYVLALPLALAYVVGIYALSLHLAAPLLLQREPAMIARLCQEE